MAQTRVNKRLLFILIAGVAILAVGVIGVAEFAKRRNPERYVQMAEELKAQGDLRGAVRAYRSAVGRDRGNVEYMTLWRDTLLQVTAEDETQAGEDFETLTRVKLTLASLRPQDADLQLQWLEHLTEMATTVSSANQWTMVRDQAQTMLDNVSPEDPKIHLGHFYRGLAVVNLLILNAANQDDLEPAREDLETALKADPSSAEALDALVNWHLLKAQTFLQRNMPNDARPMLDRAVDLADSFRQSYPESTRAAITVLRTRAQRIRMQREPTPQDMESLRPYVDEVERLALTEQIDWETTMAAAQRVAEVDREAGDSRALAIIEHGLSLDSQRPQLLFQRARFLDRLGRSEEAIEAYQAVVSQPALTTSYEAVMQYRMRPQAVSSQFDLAVAAWESVDPRDREAFGAGQAEAEGYRRTYESLTDANDPRLLYMDGRIALTAGKPEVAASKFEQYMATTGEVTPKLRLEMARALLELNQLGAAYEQLQRANQQAGGTTVPILMELARIDLKRNDLDSAQRHLGAAAAAAPETPGLQALIDTMRLARGETLDESSNPVLRALVAAQNAMQEGDIEGARSVLESALAESPENFRLLSELARLEYQTPDRTEQALEYVNRALALRPQDEAMLLLQGQLTDADLRPILKEIVARRPRLDDVERSLAESLLLSRYGFDEEADALYAQTRDSNPDHPRIVQAEFLAAIESEEFERAQDLAARASQLNLDQAEGLTYAGQLQLARGEVQAAVNSLRQAAGQKEFDGEVWRLLGRAYRAAGNYTEAINAYGQAVFRQPDDVDTLREYADMLLAAGDNTQALKVVSDALRFAPSDPVILEVFLELEGRHGDRENAIRVRRSIRDRNPGDFNNADKLVQLLLEEGEVEEAAAVISSMTPASDVQELRLVVLWSRHDAVSGRIEEGAERFDAYAADHSTDSLLLTETYLAQANYYQFVGRPEAIPGALQKGLASQDPVQRQIDRALGDYYTAQLDLETALSHYEAALEADPESEALSLRIIDLRLAQADAARLAGRSNEAATFIASAQRQLEAHAAAFGEGIETLLFTAKIARAEGEAETAQRLYNRAIQDYPTDFRAYLERARFGLSRILTAGDVALVTRFQNDVSKVLELRPNNTEALRLQATYAANRPDPNTGQPNPDLDQLVQTWRRILTVSPQDNETRERLVNFLADRGDYSSAIRVAEDAVNRNISAAYWHEYLGTLKRRRGDRFEIYSADFRRAWELEPTVVRLGKLAESYLEAEPPPGVTGASADRWLGQQAEAAVNLLESRPEWLAEELPLRLLHARSQFALGREAEGREAFAALRGEIAAKVESPVYTSEYRMWYLQVLEVMDPMEAAAFLDETSDGAPSPIENLMAGQALVNTTYRDAETDVEAWSAEAVVRMEAARRALDALAAPTEQERAMILATGRDLGQLYYLRGRYEDAASAWRWALVEFPDDFEANNNLAYVLAEQLGDPAAALEPAERAYQAEPRNATVLDTYGYVLFLNGRLADSQRVLEEATQIAAEPIIHLHLAMTLQGLGRTPDALIQLERGRTLASQRGDERMVREIEEFRLQIAGAPPSDR